MNKETTSKGKVKKRQLLIDDHEIRIGWIELKATLTKVEGTIIND